VPGWTWDPKAEQWEEGFRRLQDYIELNGDTIVPASCTVDGYPLGTWVQRQRAFYSRGTFEVDRQQRLQGLTGWTWSAVTANWEERFSRLLDYAERHGDALVPASYKVDGHNLGGWVSKQRAAYSKGALEVDRQQRLQDVPGWTWDPYADKWEEGFRRLQDYIELNGDALVPASYKVDGHNLGYWVGTQRKIYGKGTLEVDRQQRLQDVHGWQWDPHAAKWEERFSRLLDYAERHGHASVPQSYKVDGHNLGQWVTQQRADYVKGALEVDRQQRLQDVPGWAWKMN